MSHHASLAFGERSLVVFVTVNHKGTTILDRDTSIAMGVLHVAPLDHHFTVCTDLHLNCRIPQTQPAPMHQYQKSFRPPRDGAK